jgi:tetratricopeptide (TPR) repeat protein
LAQATSGTPGQVPLSKEYFVRQGAEEYLFVRINAFEAEFESRIFAPDGKLIITSELSQNSLAPVFQFIEASGDDRQLDIKVRSQRHSNRAAFELGLSSITINDQRSTMLAQAYRSVSFGLQKDQKLTGPGWSVKVGSLLNAGRVFEQFGMVEMRLWTLYFAAHLMQYQLNDFNSTLDYADQILAVVKDSPYRLLELASLQLKSAALAGLQQGSRSEQSVTSSLDAVLAEQIILAGLLDHQYEQAWALYHKARLSAEKQLYRQALEQFNGALDLANQLQADSLSRQTREAIVEIHDKEGDTQASVEVLREIESQLEAQAGNDLAENLLQQGRLLNANFLYPEAISVLRQALDHQNNSLTRRQINHELVDALFENGQEKDALAVIRNEPEIANSGQFPPSIQIRTGLSEHLDFLQSCVDNLRKPAAQRQCDLSKARQAVAAVQAMAVPRFSVQASVLWSRILAGSSMPGEALEVLEKTISDFYFYQNALPGVLGSWYWTNKKSLISEYLDLTRVQARDPKRSLLALSRIRHFEVSEELQGTTARQRSTTGTEKLRSLIAQFQHRPETITEQNRGAMAQELTELRESFDQSFAFLSQATLRQYLSDLGENDLLLTYYFGSQSTVALLADQNGVREIVLPGQAKITQLLLEVQSLRADLSGFDSQKSDRFAGLLEQLGDSLLTPIKNYLKEKIYWMPPSQLMDIPLDALSLDGHYLAEAHRLVNVMSFPIAGSPVGLAVAVPPESVFIAGFPQDFISQYATQLETTAEIRSVADYFLGQGLTILQGNALLTEEFQLEAVRTAILIHLSMPGLINLSEPFQSHLQLSEARPGEGRVKLQMSELAALKLEAKLVFLSSTTLSATTGEKGPYRPGLVTALLEAGADAVISGLWTGDDQFVAEFYRHLLEYKNISTALAQSKREMIKNSPNQNDHDWARYQLYIR